MLEKTLAVLAGLKPGSPLPEGQECFDQAELRELGHVLGALVFAPAQLRRRLQEHGVSVVPANFYSEIPQISEIEASFEHPSKLKLDLVFRDPAGLRAELRSLGSFAHEFDPPLDASSPAEYAWNGNAFTYSDAMSYYCMIRKYQPETIVEVGGGASTLIAQMACDRNGRGKVVCIDPSPAAFLRGLDGIELLEKRIQEVDTDTVADRLGEGDFLFIDSTHAVKHDSDCLHIYLRLLPALRANTIVHAHDIFLPSTIPHNYLTDLQLYWTEQYLLYAYLLGNPNTRVLYGSAYHMQSNREMLAEFMQGRFSPGGGSFWFAQAPRG